MTRFEGGKTRVTREILESFGIAVKQREAVAERSRTSPVFAATLRLLDPPGDPTPWSPGRPIGRSVRPYVEIQGLLCRAVHQDGPLTDREFADRAHWLMTEHATNPGPVSKDEYRRRVERLYEPIAIDWPV